MHSRFSFIQLCGLMSWSSLGLGLGRLPGVTSASLLVYTLNLSFPLRVFYSSLNLFVNTFSCVLCLKSLDLSFPSHIYLFHFLLDSSLQVGTRSFRTAIASRSSLFARAPRRSTAACTTASYIYFTLPLPLHFACTFFWIASFLEDVAWIE